MKRVRRGNDYAVEVLLEKFAVIGCRLLEAEVLLAASENGFVESAYRHHLDVLAGLKQRHVVGGRPPTRADESDPRFAGGGLRARRVILDFILRQQSNVPVF